MHVQQVKVGFMCYSGCSCSRNGIIRLCSLNLTYDITLLVYTEHNTDRPRPRFLLLRALFPFCLFIVVIVRAIAPVKVQHCCWVSNYLYSCYNHAIAMYISMAGTSRSGWDESRQKMKRAHSSTCPCHDVRQNLL